MSSRPHRSAPSNAHRHAGPVHRGHQAIAPIHRGPQAMSPAAQATSHHAPNAALLIDFDNVTMGIRSELQTELKNLLSSDIVKGKVSVQRAYADWRRYPQYIVPLAESSIDMIMATAYGSAKKNATDIRLAVDAMELVFTRPEIGTFILLSGDSDFASLVTKLKEYGKYVIGVGIRESSSDLLVMNCDEYYSYNALAGLVKNSEEEETAKKWDPWELVTESVSRMKRNGDVMRSDRLKQVMQEIDSTFDEKDLGMAKFSRFVQDAVQRGLLSATKLENGQLEIGLPSGAKGEARAAENAAADEAARGDGAEASEDRRREGRSRRGRRGRGRDRDDRGPRAERPAAELPLDGEAAAMPEIKAPVEVAADAAPRVEPTPRAPERGGRGERPERQERAPRVESGEQIGVTGERLTRDEAFDLVRRAVASLVTGDEAVRAGVVRAKARELLGRDSESLSDRNFPRILKDAHDNDVIDLRRRGDDFEIARAVDAESVSDQLAKTAIANAPALPAAAPMPRGMGPRGVSGPRGRGGRPGAPPPDLLSIGVVRPATPLAPPPAPAATEAVAVPSTDSATPVSAPRPAAKAAKPRAKRVAKKASDNGGAPAAADVKAPAAKKTAAKRPRAKKVAAATRES